MNKIVWCVKVINLNNDNDNNNNNNDNNNSNTYILVNYSFNVLNYF